MPGQKTAEITRGLSLTWVSHGTQSCFSPTCAIERLILSPARNLLLLEQGASKALRGSADLLFEESPLAQPGLALPSSAVSTEDELFREARLSGADVTVVCAKPDCIPDAEARQVRTSRALRELDRSVLLLRCDEAARLGPIVGVLNTPKRFSTAVTLLHRLGFAAGEQVILAAFGRPSEASLPDRGNDVIAQAMQSAWETVLSQASDSLSAAGCRVETVIRDETLSQGLPALIEERSAGLVIFGDRVNPPPDCDAMSPERLAASVACSVLVAR